VSVRGGRGARWTGGNDEVLGKAYDAKLIRRLWAFVKPHRMLAVVGLVLLLLSSLNDLAGPYFTQRAIDHYIRPGRLNGYGHLAALWALIIVLNFGARYWQSFAMNLLGQRVMFDLRNAIFSHLQRMSLAYFDHTPVGVLVTRMTNDVDALNQLLTSGLVAVIGDLFSLVVIAGFLLWVNWQMALIVFAIMPIVIAITAGVEYAFVAIPAQTALQEDLPVDVRGRIFGILNTLLSVASFLPVLVAPGAADLLNIVFPGAGIPVVMAILGLVTLTLGVASWRRNAAAGLHRQAPTGVGDEPSELGGEPPEMASSDD